MKYKILFLGIHITSVIAIGTDSATLVELKEKIQNLKNINKEVDALGRTLLHHAVANNQLPHIELLLDEGADINAPDYSGETPLHHAAFMGALHCKRNPIQTVCADRIKIIYFLLNNGANIDAQDYTGDTPLHTIMRIASVPVTKALLDYFPDVNIQNRKGKTPLRVLMQKHIYVDDPDVLTVKNLLIEADADEQIIDFKTKRHLHACA